MKKHAKSSLLLLGTMFLWHCQFFAPEVLEQPADRDDAAVAHRRVQKTLPLPLPEAIEQPLAVLEYHRAKHDDNRPQRAVFPVPALAAPSAVHSSVVAPVLTESESPTFNYPLEQPTPVAAEQPREALVNHFGAELWGSDALQPLPARHGLLSSASVKLAARETARGLWNGLSRFGEQDIATPLLREAQPSQWRPAREPLPEKPAGRETSARRTPPSPAQARLTPVNTPKPPPEPAPTTNLYEERKSVLARPGDDIEVSFAKEGWLFLGYSSQIEAEALPFQDRYQAQGSTFFTFAALSLGTYELGFVRQDNSRGIQEKVVLEVEVLAPQEFERALYGKSQEQSLPEEETHLQAERLARTGQYEAALTEFLAHYSDASPYLNESIADLYWKTGQFAKARDYWLRNIGSPKDFTDKAIVGTVKTSLELDDYNSVLLYLEPFLDIQRDELSADATALARYCLGRGDYRTAKDILDYILSAYPADPLIPEVLFLTGTLYEADTDFRDFRKSKDAYKEISGRFPESSLARQARERIKFLDRHFFYIR